MNLSKREREIANENRILAGLPVLYCPNCGRAEAHWVADTLDEYGLLVPGYFICVGVS